MLGVFEMPDQTLDLLGLLLLLQSLTPTEPPEDDLE